MKALAITAVTWIATSFGTATAAFAAVCVVQALDIPFVSDGAHSALVTYVHVLAAVVKASR